jgi:hypothetical protein
MLGEKITVRNYFRGGRRNIRAGQEETNCRPISYEEREKIWRDAVEREKATRKKGCQNGDIGKAGLAVRQQFEALRSVLLSKRTDA